MHDGRWTDAAATYTADAMLRLPDSTYQGRDAILKYFKSHQPLPAAFELHIDEVRGRGDMGFVMGHSTVSPVGGTPFVTGRYLDIRLRQPGPSRLYYRDIGEPGSAARDGALIAGGRAPFDMPAPVSRYPGGRHVWRSFLPAAPLEPTLA